VLEKITKRLTRENTLPDKIDPETAESENVNGFIP
jgi:hypothetical protein